MRIKNFSKMAQDMQGYDKKSTYFSWKAFAQDQHATLDFYRTSSLKQ